MLSDFYQGTNAALSGFMLIRQRGIKRYVIVPLLINILLFGSALWYIYARADRGITAMVEWLPDWLDWLSWLVWALLGLLLCSVAFYSFTLAANFIGSPFNGRLSEKIEQRLIGYAPPSSGQVYTTAGIKNSIHSELAKLGYLLSRSLPLLVLSFIPVINIFAPLLWFLFGAWMLALEYLDYPMGNHGIPFAEQRLKLRQRPLLALGFGMAVCGLTFIPLVNFLAMPVAVSGATRLWVLHLSRQSPA
ncbi:MAG TPA: sulfate transporter CysZ [Gammaproteobacteria bacterium]|nr:sulfate transporter CysZ [Gammaproteobacteria bacterium]